MQTQIEKKDLIRYANGLIGLMHTDETRVRAAADHIINLPKCRPWINLGNYYQGALKELEQKSFETALLGKLDSESGSLAEKFKVEDRVREELGLSTSSVERRLDLCILASTSAAMYLLAAQKKHDQEDSLLQLKWEQKRGDVAVRFNPFKRDPLLELDNARLIQRLSLELGTEQAVRICIAPAVEKYKDKKIAEYSNGQLQKQKEGAGESEFKRLGMSENDTYSYFLRYMLDAAKEGYIGDGTFDTERIESGLWFFEQEGFIPPTDIVVHFTSYAYLNKARAQLISDTYKDIFGKPKAIILQGADDVISVLTKANSFITARIPFLVNLGRITSDYDHVRESVLGKLFV